MPLSSCLASDPVPALLPLHSSTSQPLADGGGVHADTYVGAPTRPPPPRLTALLSLTTLPVQHRPPGDGGRRTGGAAPGRLGRRAAGRQLCGRWVRRLAQQPPLPPAPLQAQAPVLRTLRTLLASRSLLLLFLHHATNVWFVPLHPPLVCRRGPGQVHRVRLHLCRPGGGAAQEDRRQGLKQAASCVRSASRLLTALAALWNLIPPLPRLPPSTPLPPHSRRLCGAAWHEPSPCPSA